MTSTAMQLISKAGSPSRIAPDVSVYEALEQMAEAEVGALLVAEGERVVGIVSERDYARRVILKNRSSKTTKVCEIMTSEVIYARPDQTAEECLAVMSAKRVRHLPVLDDGRLLGILSIIDVVKAILSEKELIIEQLEHYIAGNG